MISPKSRISQISWHLGFVVGFALVAPASFADEAPPPDARAVVVQQLHAFESGDLKGAYRLAAPELRNKFSVADFTGMMEKNYGPVLRHRSVQFGPAARKGDEVGMVVTIVDDENEVWSALFLVAKQTDGQWRTTGCLMTKAEQTSV